MPPGYLAIYAANFDKVLFSFKDRKDNVGFTLGSPTFDRFAHDDSHKNRLMEIWKTLLVSHIPTTAAVMTAPFYEWSSANGGRYMWAEWGMV